MTSFTFTPEQVRAAPPEVRQWLVQEIARAMAGAQRPTPDPSQDQSISLSACSMDDALQVLERIRGDFLLMQVFFRACPRCSAGSDGAIVARPQHGRDAAPHPAE
jgi:hypothetical protein